MSQIPNDLVGTEEENCALAPTDTSASALLDYYRCPESFVRLESPQDLHGSEGFFYFDEALAYGQCRSGVALTPEDAKQTAKSPSSRALPFDLSRSVDNIRLERYMDVEPSSKRWLDSKWLTHAYYALRPALPVTIRKHFQKAHLKGWKNISFPSWPIDTTVDNLMQAVLRTALQSNPTTPIPFIWFWPEGYPACALITHDVEQVAGKDFALNLLTVDDSFEIKSSFQVVPEGRYDSSAALVASIQARGFEVNVHDLNHDGHLFKDRELFLRRAEKINEYRRSYGAKGFRSGSMYRKVEWLKEFEFLYDMSVPNAAHLEPQRGGCCTVMPYKIGNLIELPLTTTQDYSLFHIFNQYSTDLWKKQIAYLIEKNGLITFIVHPDYVIEQRARSVYQELLHYLAALREQKQLWMPFPSDAARWWGARAKMTLQRVNSKWVVRGEGSEQAMVAFASLENEQLVYRVGEERRVVSTETSLHLDN